MLRREQGRQVQQPFVKSSKSTVIGKPSVLAVGRGIFDRVISTKTQEMFTCIDFGDTIFGPLVCLTSALIFGTQTI